jgi:hypothetical protein
MPLSELDASFIDNLSMRVITNFCKPWGHSSKLEWENISGISWNDGGSGSVPFLRFQLKLTYTILQTDSTILLMDESVSRMAQHDPDAKVGSYSDGMFYIDDQSVSHTS